VSPTAEPLPREPRPTFFARARSGWSKLRGWIRRFWTDIRPGPEARKGAIWGALAVGFVTAIIGGYYLHSGFGLWVDLLFAIAVAGIGIPLGALLVALLLTLLRGLNRTATGIVAAVCAFFALVFPMFGAIFGLVAAFVGATAASIFLVRFREAPLSRKIVTIVLFTASFAAAAWIVVLLAMDGTTKDVLRYEAKSSPAPPALAAPNPSDTGPYSVKTLIYGSGADIRRAEYGKSVAIRTGTVDASTFFKDFKGWKANLRRRYWGFGMDKLPLNARVWYPEGAGPFPLALIVHGNHEMSDFSDPGYEYLGQLLASRGFILASIDENFLNSGLFHDPDKQQAVRGWMLLEHLKLWRIWNETAGNPFYKKVDVENVALMGHSRGGEAAATAALFNKLAYAPEDANIRFHYGFPIKSIVAIAPADGQYKPAGQWRYIENVSYLTLQGANDADVSSFDGSRQWDHVRYTENGPWFKAEIYAYGANHGQFNTSWGRSDFPAPLSWLLNLKPLMRGEDQRRISKTYISAFLEATLHNRREYLPLFRDYRTGRNWLPDTFYISRYQDATYHVVSDFTEDPDLTTTTAARGRIQGENFSIWREGKIPYRHGDRDYNGVFLGWNRAEQKKGEKPAVPVYSISLPADAAQNWNISPSSVLTMSLAVTEDKAPPPGKTLDDMPPDKDADKKQPEPTDFTIELQSAGGATASLALSRFGVLPPPFKVRFSKLAMLDDWFYEKASEPIFQTVELPLAAFAAQTNGFDPAKLETIRLRFDRTPSRVIILSRIGFESR
jgi:dienelactone hydrolase